MVNLSNFIVSLGTEFLELLIELLLPRAQARGDDQLHLHELVARAAGLQPRHAVARQAEGPAAGRLRRDLHRDLALERWHGELGADGRVVGRHRQGRVEVVALALEARIRPHRHLEVQVAAYAAARAALSFAAHAHARARGHPGRNLDLEVASALGPAAAAALGAWLAVDMPRSPAGAAGFVELQRDGPAHALERVLERDLDARLDVAALVGAGACAEVAEISKIEVAEAARTTAAQI